MNLEDQVVSLDLAKKLKELGFEHESLFYWVMFSSESGGNGNYFLVDKKERESGDYIFPVSAYTVAELGKMLPGNIHQHSMFVDRFHDKWLIGYSYVYDDDKPFMNTEADAKAELLIYLKTNNLL